MKQLLMLIGIVLINYARSHDSDSSEVNGLDVNPFYDTVIFSDIADVMKEFENNVNLPFDAFVNSDSESDENIEELLSEYQHYLEKAHKQRKGYLEKSQSKNKVPLLRHERFHKTKSGTGAKYDDYYFNTGFYNPTAFKFQQQYKDPLDLFIPKSKARYPPKSETTNVPKDSSNTNLEKFIFNKNSLLNIPSKPYDFIKSSCFCKNNQIPCACSCKQCLLPFETFSGKLPTEEKKYLENPSFIESSFKNQDDFSSGILKDTSGNILNIRIKVDLSLPKTSDIFGKYKNNNHDILADRGDGYSKEFVSSINLPLPYFNFPIPIDMFGYKKMSKFTKHGATPMHKITIHKKKKSRISNNNKKHSKKLITIHNFQLEPQNFQTHIGEYYNNSKFQQPAQINETQTIESVITAKKPVEVVSVNETQTEDSIYLMVNITSNNNNITGDLHKNENSIETDYIARTNENGTAENVTKLRMKRDLLSFNNSARSKMENNLAVIGLTQAKVKSNVTQFTRYYNKTKKTNKEQILPDSELLYWPISFSNRSNTHSKNITDIILETEDKKAKLNISEETIRRNHTQALEQAIFGDVDWNNVDAVAPTFISFVGKYLNGALTFCSQNICHSMKCAEKTCIHRICLPVERLNSKGHCVGSNITDSVASMESIMDLPSNIAFEIVDLLQDKMLGKLFGKTQSRKLLLKTCIVAYYVLLLTKTPNHLCSGQTTEEFYINPWSKILKPQLKLLDFNSDGNFFETNLNKNRALSLKILLKNLGNNTAMKNFMNFDNDQLDPTYNIEELGSLISIIYTSLKPRKKMKIFTRCDESKSVCRFVACPNIKEYCTVCEVKLKDNTNSTHCDKFNTRFLVTQGNAI